MSKSISVPKMHPFHLAVLHTVIPRECCESWKQTNEKVVGKLNLFLSGLLLFFPLLVNLYLSCLFCALDACC